eukprot:4862786-Pleurochrysis_carterae.AAC.3
MITKKNVGCGDDERDICRIDCGGKQAIGQRNKFSKERDQFSNVRHEVGIEEIRGRKERE